MKILIVTNYLEEKSGWGSYSLALTEQLIKNEFEIVVVCNKKSEKYNNIKQIEILPNPLSFKKNYFFAPLYALKTLFNLRNTDRFDLIHCFVEPYDFITYLISKIFGVKYFITIHGSYGVKTLRNVIYRFFQVIAYKNANKIICVSNYTKTKVLEYENLENIVIISNGVNSDSITKNNKENIVIGVGALKFRKGYHLVIEAIDLVKKQILDIKYYIIGNQEDTLYVNKLKEKITRLRLEKNILFFESISDEKLKELYKLAKIFVLTPVSTKYDFEGFGLVYLEANALGLPVIGSYDNGGEDAIRDGYNGFLVRINDSKDIVEKIVKLLDNQGLYEKMSQNAVKWSQEMSWDNIFKKYLKIYNS